MDRLVSQARRRPGVLTLTGQDNGADTRRGPGALDDEVRIVVDLPPGSLRGPMVWAVSVSEKRVRRDEAFLPRTWRPDAGMGDACRAGDPGPSCLPAFRRLLPIADASSVETTPKGAPL